MHGMTGYVTHGMTGYVTHVPVFTCAYTMIGCDMLFVISLLIIHIIKTNNIYH